MPTKPTCSIEDCTRTAGIRGWCAMHNQRWRNYGSTDSPRPSLTQRFWAKVQKSDGCWEWSGALNAAGYGHFHTVRRGHSEQAHRVSWKLHFGPIPAGMFVCHRCDNRRCVRPEHFFLGTQGDNIRDMHAKGRAPMHMHGGALHAKAKLTTADVLAIRESCTNGGSQKEWAALLGVDPSTVSNIVQRVTWRNL